MCDSNETTLSRDGEPKPAKESELSVLELVVFELASQHYALAADQVRELQRAVTVVPLPKAPAILEGVVNVRGTVTPVLDIRSRFRLPAKLLEPSDCLVIAWAGPRLVALRVDSVSELLRIDPREVDSARDVLPDAGYLAGVAKLPSGLVLIHDLATFLSAAEADALDEAIDAASGADR